MFIQVLSPLFRCRFQVQPMLNKKEGKESLCVRETETERARETKTG